MFKQKINPIECGFFIKYGAAKGNRTLILWLEARHNSHYTTAAKLNLRLKIKFVAPFLIYYYKIFIRATENFLLFVHINTRERIF